MKSLNHENVVHLYQAIKTKRNFYLVMEFCNGGDLGKLLKKHKRFEEHIVQIVTYQVAKGLKALREHNILHRDLKLSNFLLRIEKDGTYTIKLADFGFATVLSSGQAAETFCGTAPNMAPEVLMGYFSDSVIEYRQKYNEKADLWSMGTIIFMMMTGYYPFEGKHPLQVLENIKKGIQKYPPNLKISKCCKSLIYELLQNEPERRMNYEEFFKHLFVSTEPSEYLKELQTLWGPYYGLKNIFTNNTVEPQESPEPSPPRRYEKSEMMPEIKPEILPEVKKTPTKTAELLIGNDFEIIDENELKRVDSQTFNPFVEIEKKDAEPTPVNQKPDNIIMNGKITENYDTYELYKKSVSKVFEQAEILKMMIEKQTYSEKEFIHIKFFVLMNLRKRIAVLLESLKSYNFNGKIKFNVIYALNYKKKVDRIQNLLPNLPEATDIRQKLKNVYIELGKLIKDYAFVLNTFKKYVLLNEGVEWGYKLIKHAAIQEQNVVFCSLKEEYAEENDIGMKENYKAAYAILEILLHEFYVELSEPNSLMPSDTYIVTMEKSDIKEIIDQERYAINMSIIKKLLLFRKLVKQRLDKL